MVVETRVEQGVLGPDVVKQRTQELSSNIVMGKAHRHVQSDQGQILKSFQELLDLIRQDPRQICDLLVNKRKGE
ncbi:MAG: hypothetical protein Q7S88_00085 [Candidatus Daviesbacteria bacterium]|nr:hypothetical protein [Candidatus Daviesbacteria bacterium]